MNTVGKYVKALKARIENNPELKKLFSDAIAKKIAEQPSHADQTAPNTTDDSVVDTHCVHENNRQDSALAAPFEAFKEITPLMLQNKIQAMTEELALVDMAASFHHEYPKEAPSAPVIKKYIETKLEL
jgi:hypothetical protein